MPPTSGPALERLLAIHRDTGVPLALAVVPATATPALAERLAGEPGVDLLQHGYAHVNHAAPRDSKKIELGPERPAMIVLGELGTGWLALERLFGARAAAGAGAAVEPHRARPGADLAGNRLRRPVDLRPAAARAPVAGLSEVNTHVDLIDWKGGRGFVGEAAALGRAGRCLGARAHGAARARGRAQSSSCDGRRGVGFPKVDVAKSTDNARASNPRRRMNCSPHSGRGGRG